LQIREKIDCLQKDIFAYDPEAVAMQLSQLMTAIIEENAFDLNNVGKVQRFNRLMQGSLQALQDKDYLLLGDIIEFELKPLLGINEDRKKNYE